MRQAIELVSVVAALSLLGCEFNLSGVDGPLDYNFGDGDISVSVTPDSLRLQVGEVAEVRAIGGMLLSWSARDSTIVRLIERLSGPGAEHTAEVTAVRAGATWVIAAVVYAADSVWVVVK